MGCDGYILNPFAGAWFNMTCHVCGGKVDPGSPGTLHEDCIEDDGRLKVNVDNENYEPR